MSDKSIGIIRDVHFGVGDRGSVCLWLQTYVTESSAALQVFGLIDAESIILAYGVSDVGSLEGKPCWVDASHVGEIRWVGPFV